MANIAPIVAANIHRESTLMTDEAKHNQRVGATFAEHQTGHRTSKEYVRGDAYTNTIKDHFSIFKRGMKGVYQHCSEKHLHRYLAEFDFRYNERMALGVNDTMRVVSALAGISGKRLTYRGLPQGSSAE